MPPPRTFTPEQKARRKAYLTAYKAAMPPEQRERYRIAANERKKTRDRAARVWFVEQKSAPCADCGHTFPPECMDFDHRDRSTKLHNVGEMVTYSRPKVLAEIAKCDLVCANCHRIRTYGERAA